MNNMLDRIYNGDKNFTEDELQDLVWAYPSFDVIVGDARRWSQTVQTIFEIKDKYFRIEWESGLTENQEHGYFSQPEEVNCTVEEIKVIKRTYTKV